MCARRTRGCVTPDLRAMALGARGRGWPLYPELARWLVVKGRRRRTLPQRDFRGERRHPVTEPPGRRKVGRHPHDRSDGSVCSFLEQLPPDTPAIEKGAGDNDGPANESTRGGRGDWPQTPPPPATPRSTVYPPTESGIPRKGEGVLREPGRTGCGARCCPDPRLAFAAMSTSPRTRRGRRAERELLTGRQSLLPDPARQQSDVRPEFHEMALQWRRRAPKTASLETEQDGPFSVCEGCGEQVDPADPNVHAGSRDGLSGGSARRKSAKVWASIHKRMLHARGLSPR